MKEILLVNHVYNLGINGHSKAARDLQSTVDAILSGPLARF